MELIDKAAVVAEIKSLWKYYLDAQEFDFGWNQALDKVLSYLNTLEVKDVDLEKESELIANGIMISVQSNKYGTNIYNTKRNDFNHYHLQIAARKGIELGIKQRKENNYGTNSKNS